MNTEKKSTELDNTDKKLHISDVSGSVSVIDEGNINYHLERGGIEHTYFLDENKEYATCQCGRVIRKHYH